MDRQMNRGAGFVGFLAGLSLVLGACVGDVGSTPSNSSAPPASSLATASPSSEPAPATQVTLSPSPPAAPPITTIAPLPTASAPPPAGGPEVTETDNGHTVRVHAGAELKLILHNTYWQIVGSSDPLVLAPLGEPTYSGAGLISCIPGSGCGTVTQVFRAVGLGQATLTAKRTSCGEAIQCVGTTGSYQVTIVVEP